MFLPGVLNGHFSDQGRGFRGEQHEVARRCSFAGWERGLSPLQLFNPPEGDPLIESLKLLEIIVEVSTYNSRATAANDD